MNRIARATIVAITMGATAMACASAGDDPFTDEQDGGGDGAAGPSAFNPGKGACEGPLGFPQNPATMTKCCTDHPNQAHCFPSEKIPDVLKGVLAKCESGGACVPDDFIKTGGVFKPKSCKSLGGPGVCLSLCVPLVAEKAPLLPQDVCTDDEKCVPCINPIDKTTTHACDLTGACKGDDAGAPETSTPVDTGPPECPHKGPPVVEPSTFPACQCGDGHCVPSSVVPGPFASKLADCAADAKGKCVPDALIASGGEYIPPTCKSVAGAEGRCLSTCLPDVKAQMTMLPQSSCGIDERCVPCYNPLDLKETGACKLSCDPGPTEPPKALPTCCGARGTCVPKASVPPASASSLQQDKCPDNTFVCAPNAFIDKTWKRVDCTASVFFIGDGGPGVCMPDCLKGLGFPLLKGTGCSSGDKCAPCKDPLTKKPTGACEFTP